MIKLLQVFDAHLVVLSGKAILEPISQYGPFVLNSQEEIKQAIADFQNTVFLNSLRSEQLNKIKLS